MLSWIRETGWEPGFHDPSFWGWAVTAGYVLAAAISLRLARTARRDGSLHRSFWLVLSATLLVLGLNKQLDLQTLALKSASRIAQVAGWYQNKELIRTAFVAAAGAAVLAAAVWLALRKRSYLPRNPLLWAALALILVFVIARTSVLDGVFRSVGFRLDRNRPAHILELLAVSALNAALLGDAARRVKRARRPQD